MAPATRGFVKVPREVLLDPRLSEGAKLLYGLLQGYARQEGVCFPKLERLGGDLGVSERTVRDRVRELQRAGLIEVTQPAGGRANRYRLLCRVPEASRPAGRPLPAAGGSLLPPPSEVEAVEVEARERTSLSHARTATTGGEPGAGEGPVGEELALMAGRFLADIGYLSPSQAKLKRTRAVLARLHQQGHALDDLRLACRLAADRGARGPELIPHVVGETPPRPPEPTEAALALERAEAERQAEWQRREARWAALSADEQAALLERAQAENPILGRRPKDHPLVRAAAINLV